MGIRPRLSGRANQSRWLYPHIAVGFCPLRGHLRAYLPAAAWAHDLADRAPFRLEVAAASAREARKLSTKALDVSVFTPVLPYVTRNAVPVLQPVSILTHMASHPGVVRSWNSALKWLPDLAGEATVGDILTELKPRPATVIARLGYLLQGLRPDLAEQLARPGTKTWFGPRRAIIRHDNRWQIADTLLPFDPRNLTAVARAAR
ncbi:MAG: type IV toxin-antitoxin system AbiEi family antitoxin [Angustibacter sp.]